MRVRPTRTGRPRFTGVTTYTDRDGRYEFRHPSDWFREDLDDGLDGVIVGPDRDDEATHFAVAVRDLGLDVTAADLPPLREGFEEGISQLADVAVEASSDTTYNEIIKLERTLSFTEDGETRRRRIWNMYADRWQFTAVYQGATVEEFRYWLPMGNYCFSAFQLPLALWYATDPSVREQPAG